MQQLTIPDMVRKIIDNNDHLTPLDDLCSTAAAIFRDCDEWSQFQYHGQAYGCMTWGDRDRVTWSARHGWNAWAGSRPEFIRKFNQWKFDNL